MLSLDINCIVGCMLTVDNLYLVFDQISCKVALLIYLGLCVICSWLTSKEAEDAEFQTYH